MFRLPRLLGPPIAPTAADPSRRAAGPFTPRNEPGVAPVSCGIATCLSRAIGTAGLPPARLWPCRPLPMTRFRIERGESGPLSPVLPRGGALGTRSGTRRSGGSRGSGGIRGHDPELNASSGSSGHVPRSPRGLGHEDRGYDPIRQSRDRYLRPARSRRDPHPLHGTTRWRRRRRGPIRLWCQSD